MGEIKNEFVSIWDKRPPAEYLPEIRVESENHAGEVLDRMMGRERWYSNERIEIKPSENMSLEKADEIYDKIMADAFPEKTEKKQDITLEEVYDEIYNRDEDEFSFDELDLEDEKLERLLKYFSPEKWEKLDYYDKQNVIREFGSALAMKLELKNPPRIIYYSGGANDCGAYNPRGNEIKINRNMFNDAKETIDTVAHETFHAYQNERAKMSETKKDILYAINFADGNYIRPERDADGKYVNFTAYEGQLVEAEARGFAKQFSEKVGV